jgi:hypothetical protein
LGMLSTSDEMMGRLSICRECHLCTLTEGKAYCGNPLMRQLIRDGQTQGCGCPIAAKAADPGEHCPVTVGPAVANTESAPGCGCKWCRGEGPADLTRRREGREDIAKKR